MGVAAWRIDGRGPRLLMHADEAFPMASTFKVAVAGALLAKIDAGTLTLHRMIPVDPKLYVESDLIADALIHPGVSLSVQNLLELMLTRSDNTATDVLTAAAGGPEAVTEWLHKQGVNGQRVDRDTAGILRDFFDFPPGAFSEALAAARKADSQTRRTRESSETCFRRRSARYLDPEGDGRTVDSHPQRPRALAEQHRPPDCDHGALPHRRQSTQGSITRGHNCGQQDWHPRRIGQ